MADTLYTIKFNNGAMSFEVQGPNETWVDEKVNELKELIERLPVLPNGGQAAAPAGQKSPRRSPSRSSSKSTNTVENQVAAKWDEDVAAAVVAYVKERQGGFDKGLTKQATVIATFLKDELQVELVSPVDLEFIYRKLGWNTVNHSAQLSNALSRDKYFAKNDGKFELTHAGLVFGRDTAKTVEKAKK